LEERDLQPFAPSRLSLRLGISSQLQNDLCTTRVFRSSFITHRFAPHSFFADTEQKL